ncbi:abortive infection system antitoxin AbiGi family protein [Aquibacillus kalidii]|uniref:abortive infection system antitoxin AbiGi family protein n=1 Tax=Aquibacillus kalidii TaxID=2762597 RepID=UPI0016440C04|nr:abortive infection system antitoxin AbiGi family protein [Aquibacillus kalidii]
MSKPRFYSNIYWHFTGGPSTKGRDVVWHGYKSLKDVKRNYDLRDPLKAMENLKTIISQKTLKATSTELVSEKVETKKFCCVCDIPLNDLIYHRKYYGDYAIGFASKEIHQHFHPVLYLDPYYDQLNTSKSTVMDSKKVWEVVGLHKENPLVNFIKITSFAKDYDHSFYGEREWRCLEDFHFETGNVEAIIVPKEEVEIIHNHLLKYGYHNISILSWDLINNI